jgi:hypothetical protein
VEGRSTAPAHRPTVGAMPELEVDPEVLDAAARAVAADRRRVEHAAAVLEPAVRDLAAALPGSRTAATADRTGAELGASVRALTSELALLAGALGVAAGEYAATDHRAVPGAGRVGRQPA